jgi:hypothetical protein
MAHQYVANLDRVVQLVKEHLTQNQREVLGADKIKGLWWVMMLRGICWGMSLNIKLQPDALVPSHLYYSTTPVYIL